MTMRTFLVVMWFVLMLALPGCTQTTEDVTQPDGDVSDEDGDADEAPDGDTEPDGDAEPDGDDPSDGDGTPDGDVSDEDGDTDEAPDGDLDGDEDGDSDEPPRSEEFLSMTFNIRTGTADDGANAWSQRRDIVTNLIAQQQPDIMGVQEAWKFQLDYIRDNVPGYDWVGVSRENLTAVDEYCAVFFRTDRFALLATGTFWISETPDVPGSTFGSGQNYVRIITWAALESLVSGRTITIFNTHFDTSSADEIPERSAVLLIRQSLAIGGTHPALIMGDFNQHVGSNAYRILTGDMEYDGVRGHFIDPWAVLELAEEGTFHRFTGVATNTSRIDWIFGTEALSPLAAEVLHYEENGFFPSDHFPVTTRYFWGEDGPASR